MKSIRYIPFIFLLITLQSAALGVESGNSINGFNTDTLQTANSANNNSTAQASAATPGTTAPSASPFALGDASPNPARGNTWISYTLPDGEKNGQLVIRNLLGNPVMTIVLDPETSRVQLDTSNLNNGIYIYTLVVNRQPVKSKRVMVSN